MKEIKFNNGKIGVIVEVADIFFAQKKYDSYLPKEYEIEWDEKEKEIFNRWEKGKQKNLIKKIIAEKKKIGYNFINIYTQEWLSQKLGKPLALGLNGVYILYFKK